jgi:RNA polymerase sigma-70 factor (ECF subfamily)
MANEEAQPARAGSYAGGAERAVQPDQDSEAAVAADLVRRIRIGDRSAEDQLVRRYSRGLLVHLRRMTNDPAWSDDLHQETFRVVLERLRSEALTEPERLASFLLRTGRNLFLGAWRKRTRRGEGTSLDGLEAELEHEIPDPAPGQLAAILREERIRRVQRLIGELATPRDRQVLFRFYVAEEDRERICADLGLTGQHFNRVLFRARQRLKELLHESG